MFLRGVTWIKANRAEAVKLMDKYYKGDGVTLPEKAYNAEIDRRPMYTLQEQLKMFDRASGAAIVGGWSRASASSSRASARCRRRPTPRATARMKC